MLIHAYFLRSLAEILDLLLVFIKLNNLKTFMNNFDFILEFRVKILINNKTS